MERAIKDDLNLVTVLDHIFAEEAKSRRNRAYEKQVQLSGFPIKKTLAEFDFGFQISIDKRQIEERRFTTNSVERLNEEIRRRERVIRIFSNRALADRLLGAILMEHSEKWLIGKRYLNMDAYWQWCTENGTPSSKVVRLKYQFRLRDFTHKFGLDLFC